MKALSRFRSWLRSATYRSRLEREMTDELRFHVDERAAELVRGGMAPAEAARRARVEFGAVEARKEEMRETLGLHLLDQLGADLRLGVRMFIKYPGLTLFGGLGMTVAIAIGVTSFAFLYASLHPTLPLDEGERIVGLETWDQARNNQEYRILHDFVTWRDELKSVEDLGAFRPIVRNLIAPDGHVEPITGAEMTASGFRVARVPPLLGRPLVEADEGKEAAPVIVIGYDVWRIRFSSDPTVVGQSLRLGDTAHTVVGVMPEGFAFPVSQHAWVPLRWASSDYERRSGPEINVFGRLAPGVTLAAAQAELTIIGQRAAAAFPRTHERLRPRIVRYTELWFDDGPRSQMHVVQILVTMLLIAVCANVSVLMYARTVTRGAEISMRTALGASRRRIVGQIFVEALVLSGAAAAAGLVLASFALSKADAAAEQFGALFEGGGVPFWMNFELSPGTVVYALALTVLGAVIVGVIPAVRATGSGMQAGIRQLAGTASLRLGATWTALIVVQVAFAVAVLPGAVFMASQSIRQAGAGPGFPAEQFVTSRLEMDANTPWSGQLEVYDREYGLRYADRLVELTRRLAAEPGVSNVTFSSAYPGGEGTDSIEIENATQPAASASGQARILQVAVDFFDAFDIPILTGRGFGPGDLDTGASTSERAPASRAVIVNRTFVEQFVGDGHALGRRVRYGSSERDGRAGRSYEIVGVVANLPANPIVARETEARLYHPMRPEQAYPVRLIVRLRGAAPEAFGSRLREISSGLDPMLRLSEVLTLRDVYRLEQMGLFWGAFAFELVTLSVLLQSAGGVYALMSFTVTRRRREIGIRAALGADRQRILRNIFARVLAQLVLGIVVGVLAGILLDTALGGELMGGYGIVILPVVSALMMAVGLLAALGPAPRGLRIQPTEALRDL